MANQTNQTSKGKDRGMGNNSRGTQGGVGKTGGIGQQKQAKPTGEMEEEEEDVEDTDIQGTGKSDRSGGGFSGGSKDRGFKGSGQTQQYADDE